MIELLILAPLRIEAQALGRGVRSAVREAARSAARPAGAGRTTVVRTGMGPKAATRAGDRLAALATGGPVAVAGFCGGLRPEIRTGDVIVASELRGPAGVLALPSALAVAEALRSAGLTVHVGPIAASEQVALGSRRARVAADGSIGVDMESYWLLEEYAGSGTQPGGVAAVEGAGLTAAPAAAPAPGRVMVVRTVSDTAGKRFFGGMLPFGWLRAYRSLVRVGAVLEEWTGSVLTSRP